MTEEVGKKVCEGTVADLMKDKTGKQTVVTLTRKNAYRVKKIREQGTDNEAVLFHFRKRCTGMGSYVQYTPSKRQTGKQNCIQMNLKNGKLWNSCIPAIWKTCLMLHTTHTDGVPSNLKQGRKQTSCNMKNNL